MVRGIVIAVALLSCLIGPAWADDPPESRPVAESLADAAELYWAGEYEDAVEAYQALNEEHLLRADVAVGLATAQAMQGDDAEALASLGAAADQGQGDPAWQVAMAEALTRFGRYDEALDHAAQANELVPTWARAILVRGRLLETLGRSDEALVVYETLEGAVADDARNDDPDQLVALGQILDRYATLKGLTASEQADNIFNNYFQRAYQDADDRYWPAHLAAGQFALAKQRPMTAGREFAAALEINENLAAALVGLAELARRDWEFEDCMAISARALTLNPRCIEAMKTQARCLLEWERVAAALPILTAALEINPNDEGALSLAAATCVRLGRQAEADAYAERVAEINPTSWLLPATIGQWLSGAREFAQAEAYLQTAVVLAPHAAEPLTELGLLYMQTGREDDAREILKRAHEIDDFRSDVVNYLNLLRRMRRYEVVETPHFLITIDGEHDMALLRLVAEEAERIYDEVCADFGHEPTAKTKVQIFPTHKQFSIRITGRGWIGTVGACTGRVIAMVAPSDARSDFGTYNWVTVLRHEFTHTVTLSMTANRIPHWFTEACAVWEQPDRRNYDSVQAVVGAVREDRMLPIKELNWGFMRPRRRGDRSLAYVQSELIMEFIIEREGFDAVLAMLEAFRDGQTQEQIFADVLGMTEEELDREFFAWAKRLVGNWGFETRQIPDLETASESAEDNPDDAEKLAQYAEALLYAGRYGDAEDTAHDALAIDPDQPMALFVAAEAALLDLEYDEAIRLAEHLEDVEPDSAAAARIMADGYLGIRAYTFAIESLEQLKLRRPLDPYSYTWLTNIYSQLGYPEKALPNLLELNRRTMTEQQYPRQIADYYQSQNEEEYALTYYQQVTHINPYEASAYEAMAAIHRNARRYDDAVAAAQSLTFLEPESAEAWAKLAMVRFVAARSADDLEGMTQARDEAAKSVELDANGPAGPILEQIDHALQAMEQESDPQ